MPWLINPAQLEKFRKNQKNVVILDASWHLDDVNRNPQEEFEREHIIHAQFLNLQAFSVNDIQKNADMLGELGITSDHKIILYDQSNHHTSCYALWLFKLLGHSTQQLYILDGGFLAWQNEGGKLENGPSRHVHAKTYAPHYQAQYIRTLEQMKDNVRAPQEQVIDVRHPVSYAGKKMSDLRPGHLPGSFSFPYLSLFETDGTWRSIDRLRKLLTGLGIELNVPIVTLCETGVSSCTLNFTLDLMNQHNNAVYAGSWTEWGSAALLPGETDLSERPVKTSLEE